MLPKRKIEKPLVIDPRLTHFLAYFMDPKSVSFGKRKDSALRAGYPESVANSIITCIPEWAKQQIIDASSSMLAKAERNLDQFLELPNETQAMSMYGPVFETVKKKVQVGKFKNGKPKFKEIKEKKPVMTLNPKIMKIKQDTSHFIAERVGKIKYGPRAGEGGNTYNIAIFANDQRAKIAKRIIRGGSISDIPSPGESD